MKTGALGWGGEVAGFVASEPPVTIAGNEGVNGIAKRTGDDAEDGEQVPREAKE